MQFILYKYGKCDAIRMILSNKFTCSVKIVMKPILSRQKFEQIKNEL